jgi:hypothetical protein
MYYRFVMLSERRRDVASAPPASPRAPRPRMAMAAITPPLRPPLSPPALAEARDGLLLPAPPQRSPVTVRSETAGAELFAFAAAFWPALAFGRG